MQTAMRRRRRAGYRPADWLWLSLMLVLAGCGRPSGPDRHELGESREFHLGSKGKAFPVKISTVMREPISLRFRSSTTLEGERDLDVIAEVAGLVRKVEVQEGMTVQQGQILARLDDRVLRISRDRAKTQYNHAKLVYERKIASRASGIVSEDEVEDSRHAMELAQSDLQLAQMALDHATILAPAGGLVSQCHVVDGQNIERGETVCNIVDLQPMLATVYIPEREVARIVIGQQAEIIAESFPAELFGGVVCRIAPTIDPASGTVRVLLEIKDDKQKLRPGMFCEVNIILETHTDAVVIPKRAIVWEGEQQGVFTIQDDMAVYHDIETGFREGERVEVVDGLEAGEHLVVVGQDAIKDGTPLKVLE